VPLKSDENDATKKLNEPIDDSFENQEPNIDSYSLIQYQQANLAATKNMSKKKNKSRAIKSQVSGTKSSNFDKN